MSGQAFSRLAQFIKEFIYKNNWDELRDIQTEACNCIFDTNHHLLISSGTASGKTEAAFFPILTTLSQNPASSVGVLYIGPLKALINNQFARLKELLNESNIPVWRWHGDVSQSEKKRLLKNPSGILQITPESLESLLMTHYEDIARLFSDLRYIIIDEVHAFMGSDRGLQLQCHINRIERAAGLKPRRIGLSATLGDYSAALGWLSMGSDTISDIIQETRAKRKIRLAAEHFMYYKKNGEDTEARQDFNEFYDFIYENSRDKKCIVFTNTRGDAEDIISKMRTLAKKYSHQDVFHVHHGSLSTALRHETEEVLRNENIPSVTAATLTLELGIDIGDLERVVQVGAPYSCSSFVQRMGRSGRRSGISEMWFVSPPEIRSADDLLPEMLPWELLRIIAIIQLYIEERWIEPIGKKNYPYSLLYHQTMSALVSFTELTPRELANSILTLPPFESITEEDYRLLLNHMLSIKHIQKTDEGSLIIGLAGERIVNDYHFYFVLPEEQEYKVVYENTELGTVNILPDPGGSLSLAGHIWRVCKIDTSHKLITVKPSNGNTKKLWDGKGADIHYRIVQRMKRILAEDNVYPYLQEDAVKRLEEARSFARKNGILNSNTFIADDKGFFYIPWLGKRQMTTLQHIFKLPMVRENLNIQDCRYINYFTFELKCGYNPVEFERALAKWIVQINDALEIVGDKRMFGLNDKYDEFIPFELLRKSFAYDRLELGYIKKWAESIVKSQIEHKI